MIPPALRWPDAEQLLLDYLRPGIAALSTSTYPSLTGIGVHSRLPNPPTPPLIRVSRLGGVIDETGLFDQPRVLVESWAARADYAAANIDIVRDLLHRLPGVRSGFTVSALTEVGGPANVADPQTSTPRYLLTVAFRVRGLART